MFPEQLGYSSHKTRAHSPADPEWSLSLAVRRSYAFFSLLLMLLLMVMNLKWTYDLVMGKVRAWTFDHTDRNTEVAQQSHARVCD